MMTKKADEGVVTRPDGSKRYPVLHKGKTVYVSIPGSDDPGPGPDTEDAFVRFLDEAIEAYAESSEIARAEAALLKAPRTGLVVRFDNAEFQITVKKATRRPRGA
jgi:hypothetical protein